MKSFASIIIIYFLLLLASAALAQSPEGKWSSTEFDLHRYGFLKVDEHRYEEGKAKFEALRVN